MKQILRRILTVILLSWCISTCAFAAEPAFSFELTVDNTACKQVSTGDIITITLTLRRQGTDASYLMHAMQDEICYDSTFFQLLEDSVAVKPGIITRDIALLDNHRALYMNCLSMSGGELWDAETQIGSFQLKVIGTAGAAKIFSQNSLVSRGDSSETHAVSCQDAMVVISNDCTVQFHTKSASVISPQIVSRGGKVQVPVEPVRTGYHFGGWYSDLECTRPWNFERDTVEFNLHLYAKWQKTSFAQRFSDVRKEDWFFADVEYAAEKGLMDGVGNGRFAPGQSTSRAMIVTILWRLEGRPLTDAEMTFLDVSTGQWYTEAVRWATEHGIVTGYSSHQFGPNDVVTREQMATILFRYAAYKGYDRTTCADLNAFRDSHRVSPWARDALSWANGEKLINGMTESLLAPQNHATRSQTAAILHRFCINIS